MGSILHLFESNQATTSQKLLAHKRRSDGLEAPRNSLELPIETSSYHAMCDNIPYSYQVKQNTSKRNIYPNGTPVKKLIDEEISKPKKNRRNVPSVIAHLMGMDMLPIEKIPTIQAAERRKEDAKNGVLSKEKAGNGSTHSSPLRPKPAKQTKKYLLPHINKRDPECLKLSKQQPREHPQEEQLQKFKKEFEAWQASKVWQRSRSAGMDGNLRQWEDYQTLAQENLNMEKMARYANSVRNSAQNLHGELEDYNLPFAMETSTQQMGGLRHYGHRSKPFQFNEKEALMLNSRTKTCDFKQFPQMHCDDKCGRPSVPTRIVVLKPGLERSSDTEESWPGLSEIVEEEVSIEDFLEEVKERLRLEIQGNTRKHNTVRGGEFEIPFSEKPTGPKEIAQHIAKHVRESVTKDLATNLPRSESTRSFINSVQSNELGYPEFINRDTRTLLSERLRNILRNETDAGINTVINGNSIPFMLDREQGSVRPMEDVSKNRKKVSQWEYMKDEHGTKVRSSRHDQKKDASFDTGEISPRNLTRSLSAPVSGTAFGRLLLGEPHVLSGAHIRRKHEATENVSVEVRKNKKETSSFRGKVSNLRHGFSLRCRFFGKKIQSVEETGVRVSESMKSSSSMNVPTVVMNLGCAQENSTEVPPSPASVCSSPQEHFFRPGGHPSPASPLDIPFIEDHPVPQVFKEISSNLLEFRRQLNRLLQCDGPEEAPVEDDLLEPEEDNSEGQAHVYIRDVLVVAGLYDGSSPLTNPINSRVFEEVEEASRRCAKEGEEAIKDASESNVGHKLLFDLLNESLSIISRPITRSRFMRGVLGHPTAVPRGKKLLDDVWKMVRIYVHPPSDSCHSIDSMVAFDLTTTHWSSMMNDEIDVIGSELERMIARELVEETMWDLCHSWCVDYCSYL
ncbi:uncharacterized protein LOC131243328 isoform X2 [Magnolia sinica]|uniref:uncharacterized protein LOC131243328 isoform X2 n=1 Tax=Magnolia sinica TaxID=86752 RepID=UPI0026596373|nr:uncharacterized protein LOC131243328 isoform X2 [Magnolia sinica]